MEKVERKERCLNCGKRLKRGPFCALGCYNEWRYWSIKELEEMHERDGGLHKQHYRNIERNG